MRPHRATRGALAVLLLAALAASCGGPRGAPAAGEDWPELPPEAVVYIEEQLADDLRREMGPDVRRHGLRVPLSGLSFGRPVPTYAYTRAFLDGEARGERERAFAESGMWEIPVSQGGVPRTVVFLARHDRGTWSLAGYGGSAGKAELLATLRSGDLLVFDGPLDATFLVRGTEVSQVDGGRVSMTQPVRLDRFHDWLMAAYADLTPVGPDETN